MGIWMPRNVCGILCVFIFVCSDIFFDILFWHRLSLVTQLMVIVDALALYWERGSLIFGLFIVKQFALKQAALFFGL